MQRWIKEIYQLMLLPNGKKASIDDLVAISGFNPEGKLKWHLFYKGGLTFYMNKKGREIIPVREFIQRKIDEKCLDG